MPTARKSVGRRCKPSCCRPLPITTPTPMAPLAAAACPAAPTAPPTPTPPGPRRATVRDVASPPRVHRATHADGVVGRRAAPNAPGGVGATMCAVAPPPRVDRIALGPESQEPRSMILQARPATPPLLELSHDGAPHAVAPPHCVDHIIAHAGGAPPRRSGSCPCSAPTMLGTPRCAAPASKTVRTSTRQRKNGKNMCHHLSFMVRFAREKRAFSRAPRLTLQTDR
jgi:hypothetical protein